MEPTPDAVVEAARAMTGLSDFESESFREGLEIYLADVAEDTFLTESGLTRILGQAVVQLANRLQVDAWLREHPEALDVPIREPLFVCGMPRTGTTLTIDLIHSDPSSRCLLNWEAKRCIPPPTPDTLDRDPRLIELRAQLAPALEGMKAAGMPIPHWEEADDPTECIFVLAQDFRCLMWGSLFPARRYNEWVMEADPAPAYRHLERVLKVLQWKVRGRWSLKMPSHSLNLPTLRTVFPDAKVVVTHRDPNRALGSLCSMISHAHTMYRSEADIEYVARTYPAQLAEHALRPMAYREANGDEGFLDVRYADLVEDPIKEMKRIYAFAGNAWNADVERGMRECLAANPQNKHGAHRYDLSRFNLDQAELDRVFEAYQARYNVPTEAS